MNVFEYGLQAGIMKPVRSCLSLLLLLCGVGFSQNAQTSDTTRLLNCLIEGHIPDEPARAEQGGYLFEYQSLRGVTEDNRACTIYRLRNSPDKPPTPFRWTLGDEVVVDKVRLARCGTGAEDCPWVTFAKYFPGKIDTNLSTLSYGLNADAYHEQVSTFMTTFGIQDSEVAQAEAILASSVGTEIEGVFASNDDESIALHLIVKSRFEPNPSGGVNLIYEISDLSGSGVLGSDSIRIEWDASSAIQPVAALLDAADAQGDGVAELKTASEDSSSLSRSANDLSVVIPTEDFLLDETFRFEVYAKGDEEPLVSVEMPAYVPTSVR